MSSAPPNGLLRAEIKHLKEINAELLAALEAILADEDLIYTGGGYATLENAGLDHTDALAAKARAAITKAKGEQ